MTLNELCGKVHQLLSNGYGDASITVVDDSLSRRRTLSVVDIDIQFNRETCDTCGHETNRSSVVILTNPCPLP